MLNVSEIYAGEYYNADSVPREGVCLTIIGARAERMSQSDTREKIILSFRDDEKELALNKTNSAVLAEAYGDDAHTWIGQKVHLAIGRVLYMGKPVKGVVVAADKDGKPSF